MQWTVHGERTIYDSPWLRLVMTDVELPDGKRFEHHVLRMPRPAAGTVVHDPERGVLLLWRHRFITDTWGWEVPAGLVDDGESPEQAAAREAEEESGWRPGPLRFWTSFHPTNGLSDHTYHVFGADSAEHIGPPTDITEASRIEWVPVDDVRRAVLEGSVHDGLSVVALLWFLAFAAPGPT